jgi:hypothetical protein
MIATILRAETGHRVQTTSCMRRARTALNSQLPGSRNYQVAAYERMGRRLTIWEKTARASNYGPLKNVVKELRLYLTRFHSSRAFYLLEQAEELFANNREIFEYAARQRSS